MRSRGVHAVLIAVASLVIVFPGRAQGQVLVIAERDLSFGMVTPGVPTTVLPTDMVRSAQLRVQGRGRYQVNFVLPSQLTRIGGGSMPVTWGTTAGLLTIRSSVTAFDPTQTLDFRINPSQQEAQINLGAQLTPASGQPAGTYTATIVMLVVETGN